MLENTTVQVNVTVHSTFVVKSYLKILYSRCCIFFKILLKLFVVSVASPVGFSCMVQRYEYVADFAIKYQLSLIYIYIHLYSPVGIEAYII